MPTNLYVVAGSIIFPVLAIFWICCIACCVYKSLIKSLTKNGTTTKVVVSNRRDSEESTSSSSQPHNLSASFSSSALSPRPSVAQMPGVVSEDPFRGHYSPVVAVPVGLQKSLESQGLSLNDSLGPVYYPKYPQSQVTVSETPKRQNMSPMAPLQPPWPHLPPLNDAKKEQKKKVPTSVRSFLERQP